MTNITEKQEKGLARVLKDFFDTEAAGGLVMVFAALLAMIIANVPSLKEAYSHFIYMPISIGYGEYLLELPLKKFTKDVLMVIFFMVVGLELKREMLEGFLSQKGQKLLPAIAALGGILIPATLYYTMTHSYPQLLEGWAIPTATDIAFAVGVLAMVGRYMPPAAKIFLLAIAIYDDLVAILIVALFYGKGFSLDYIVPLLTVLLILYLLHAARIRYLSPYYIACIFLAIFLYKTGLHSTIAGVVTAMFIPMRLKEKKSQSPLGTAMHYLHPWVSYCILPLFAFVSSGIVFEGMNLSHLLSPLSLAIAAALFLGKQIGIFSFTFLTIRLGFANRPENTGWIDIYAMSVLAGIGFTMSLFIGLLAFSDVALQSEAKIGVILGSLLSTLWAVALIQYIQKKKLLNSN